jgi:hypothetical protein
LPGCDNPACVFSPTGCNGSSGSVGGRPATLPTDGEWIQVAPPAILRHFPLSTPAVDIRTPIVIIFSESMQPVNAGTTPPSGIASAFEIQTTASGSLPFAAGTLVGDGRVLVLSAALPLAAATTYNIVMHDTAILLDHTGQVVTRPSNGLIGTFSTVAAADTTPRVLGTWPDANVSNESATAEIGVAFDRPMDPTTVTTSSFVVTVDGGPPPFNPAPTALSLGAAGSDPRVYTWKCVDASGIPAPLGEGVHVGVELSPFGHEIESIGGNPLAHMTYAFDTAAFSAPLSAAITSVPNDAIGIDAISGPADLAIQVELSGAQSGDFLVLTMFGKDPEVPENPPLIALRREVALTAPFDSFTWTAAEIDLLLSSNPVRGRFADGDVAFAFQVHRGSAISPIRLLDTDASKTGVQSPLLDTTPPTILGLGNSGTGSRSMRSDVRDVVLYGRASERLLKAEVTTALGNNEITPGQIPPVVGSTDTGVFIAAPVRLGVLAEADEQLDYTLTIYDRALNSSTVQSDVADPTDGFRQVGASGPGTALPGGNISVEVYDASTLAPVSAATVYVHQVLASAIHPLGTASTSAAGTAVVAAAPGGTTIVTVEKTGYALFSFQGVPTTRLSVPLTPSPLLPGTALGVVGPLDQSSAGDLNDYARAVGDSRHVDSVPFLSPVQVCAVGADPPNFDCPFGPIVIAPNRIGGQTALSVLVPASVFDYSALTFLKAASLQVPVAAALPGATVVSAIPVPFLLDDGNLDPEERPLDVPQHMLSTAAWPILAGNPVITVEAVCPGIGATVAVGQGAAFDDGQPLDTWIVRAAYPGSADGSVDFPGDLLGSLVTQGTIDPDLFIGVEVADLVGNRGGTRPRFSATTLSLTPPPAPVLPANPITADIGNQGFLLRFPDVMPDAVSPSGRGIYRVVLSDSTGRTWIVFLPDPRNGAGPNAIVYLPNLSGVFPLASGSVGARVSGWSWPTLNLARFLWTDIEREHDLFVHSTVQTFTLP